MLYQVFRCDQCNGEIPNHPMADITSGHKEWCPTRKELEAYKRHRMGWKTPNSLNNSTSSIKKED